MYHVIHPLGKQVRAAVPNVLCDSPFSECTFTTALFCIIAGEKHFYS